VVNSIDLQREVTDSKLEELLKVGGEDDSLDFKEVCSAPLGLDSWQSENQRVYYRQEGGT
jgi:hypothetical protein